VNFLFPEGALDLTETAVLSVALSFSVAGVSGLFLGLSPIGLTLGSIVVALSGVGVILAVLAFLRKSGMIKAPVLRRRHPKVPSQ
jgi:uncharacterized membrane protein